MTKKLSTILFSLLFLVGVGLGQSGLNTSSLSSTTLSAAVSNSYTTTVVVASATGISAPSASDPTKATILFVDNEAMFVNSVSGTTLSVTRGYAGTKATGHISGVKVYLGPPYQFVAYDQQGSCSTNGSQTLNLSSGSVDTCIAGIWVGGYGYDQKIITCGTGTACSTKLATNPLIVVGSCAASSATSCVVTGLPSVPTLSNCNVIDKTNVNIGPVKAVWATNTLTITSSASSSDTFGYTCVAYY